MQILPNKTISLVGLLRLKPTAYIHKINGQIADEEIEVDISEVYEDYLDKENPGFVKYTFVDDDITPVCFSFSASLKESVDSSTSFTIQDVSGNSHIIELASTRLLNRETITHKLTMLQYYKFIVKYFDGYSYIEVPCVCAFPNKPQDELKTSLLELAAEHFSFDLEEEDGELIGRTHGDLAVSIGSITPIDLDAFLNFKSIFPGNTFYDRNYLDLEENAPLLADFHNFIRWPGVAPQNNDS